MPLLSPEELMVAQLISQTLTQNSRSWPAPRLRVRHIWHLLNGSWPLGALPKCQDKRKTHLCPPISRVKKLGQERKASLGRETRAGEAQIEVGQEETRMEAKERTLT